MAMRNVFHESISTGGDALQKIELEGNAINYFAFALRFKSLY